MSCNFSSSTHVNFTRVSITEAMYERSHVNVKVARGSIFTCTRDNTTLCLYFITPVLVKFTLRAYARKNYATVKIHPK